MAKQGKRPTRRQQQLISSYGLNPENWLVERDTPGELIVIHRNTNQQKAFPKGA
ncbi:DUF6906 family protein [Paenibacillus silvisoli]|uniref:DUF6906 family protein n=1 Tax=Paenibacillus silvisoli TaxID=3110539 RepID=UPI003898DD2C